MTFDEWFRKSIPPSLWYAREDFRGCWNAARCESADLREALHGCIEQFGYVRKGKLGAGGLSALEQAFAVLGLEDPHPAPAHLVCDEPGCGDAASCGTPTLGGYRRTCDKHMPAKQSSTGDGK